jgi:hypothetical protein
MRQDVYLVSTIAVTDMALRTVMVGTANGPCFCLLGKTLMSLVGSPFKVRKDNISSLVAVPCWRIYEMMRMIRSTLMSFIEIKFYELCSVVNAKPHTCDIYWQETNICFPLIQT